MQSSEPTVTQMLDMLEKDEFYAALRSRNISKTDRAYIEEFTSKTLTAEEWGDFSTHCIQNQIDPYKEMREMIYATYGKILKMKQH